LRITEKVVWITHQLLMRDVYKDYCEKLIATLQDILERPSFKFKEDTKTNRIARPGFDGDDVDRCVQSSAFKEYILKLLLELWAVLVNLL